MSNNEEEHKNKPEPKGSGDVSAEDTGAEHIEEAGGAPEDPGAIEEIEDDSGEEVSEEEPEGTDALREELEQVSKERDDYLDALRRVKAEFENYRKRQEREKERITQVAAERLVKDLLPVVDNLERALESKGDIRGGVSSTRDQFFNVLEQEGLVPVASDGQHFDPNVHEAVMGQESEEYEEGTIIQTFQRGYMLNGKPIRPAKVVVAS